MAYEVPDVDATAEIIQLAVLEVVHNETTIVIHTKPGTAAFVAEVIDLGMDPEILGTVAGENVVFVAPRSIKKMKAALDSICKIIHYKRK